MKKRHSKNSMTLLPLSRREFLKSSLALAGPAAFLPGILSWAGAKTMASPRSDEELCQHKFTLAAEEGLQYKPIGDVMIAIGLSFVGTTYVPNALEQPGEEQLVVNLQELDCVTFVESTLALARCIKLGKTTFEEFKHQLQLIRYRSGLINEYPSRLHYFSDWIYDNEVKKIVRNETRAIGGDPYKKKLHFMSTHRTSYRQLGEEKHFTKITETERLLNTRHHYFIPKGKLNSVQSGIRSGDIIAITSALEGMDIGHTGLGIRVNGDLKFLHAPLTSGSVQVTNDTLVQYLMAHAKQTGIMVARPLEPTD
jgi:hypothetical protein